MTGVETLTHIRDIAPGSLIPLFGGIVEVHLVADPPDGFPTAVAMWVTPIGHRPDGSNPSETMVLMPADAQLLVVPGGRR